MINLDAEEVVSSVKIIYLDIEVFIKKIMITLVFEINSSGIYTAITLMNQNTMVLLQIIVLGSEIHYLRIVVFPLVSRLVDVITKDKYFWIFYQKFLQLCWYNLCPNLQDQYYMLELRQALLIPQTDCYFS